MYRIGGRLGNMSVSLCGVDVGILPLCYGYSNPDRLSLSETVSDGQFDWGGRLLKGNGGAQRLAQHGRKPCL